jgi:hypothetical protein
MDDAKRLQEDAPPQPAPSRNDSVTTALCPLCDEPMGQRPSKLIHFEVDPPELAMPAHATCAFEYARFGKAWGSIVLPVTPDS